MSIKNINGEFRKEVIKLIENNVDKKKAIGDLQFKYPTLSKNIINNTYQKIKEELDRDKEKVDTQIEAAFEYIFGEGEAMEKEDKKVDVEEVNKAKIKGLKVLEEKVIKAIRVEGANGYYEAQTDRGVVLNNDDRNIRFENEQQLEEWVNEFKLVFNMIK